VHHFIAIDLGAASGRVVLGRLADGRLTLAEAHRFDNVPLKLGETLRWDVEAIERGIREGVSRARTLAVGEEIHGLAVDSWGVDYVLLDEHDRPVATPFHYRDHRTDGAMEQVCERIGRDRIFRRTGVQFAPFNTIYQLAAEDPGAIRRAERLLMTADYYAHRLGGQTVGEVTLASTSQLVDPRTRTWALDLVEELALEASPARLLPELVEAGALIGDCDGIPVIAAAAHDTAAAVAGCPGLGPEGAFLSSGTWSLMGLELPQPVLTPAALDANLSNELGICGTTRLLRNIMGLWPLQECRRDWAEAGRDTSWEELIALAQQAKPLSAVIDPDDRRFLAPGNMVGKIGEVCRETGQTPPEEVGQIARVVLEALALKCRWTLERLEEVTGHTVTAVHMVGGGVRNRLLCRMTADACARTLVAGPAEATAAGNVLTQAIGTGAIGSLKEAREVLAKSLELGEYEPQTSSAWDEAYGRLQEMIRQ